jgi:hypothetical protein
MKGIKTGLLAAACAFLLSCDEGGDDASCPCDGDTDSDSDSDADTDSDTDADTDVVEADFDGAPPFVIDTVPSSGAVVDASSTTEIRVTFSRPMFESWSWVTFGRDGVAEIEDQTNPRIDGRTASIDVGLVPGTTYGVWLNSPSGTYNNFQSLDGVTAVPYALVFQTAEE